MVCEQYARVPPTPGTSSPNCLRLWLIAGRRRSLAARCGLQGRGVSGRAQPQGHQDEEEERDPRAALVGESLLAGGPWIVT